jgi:hypothetical protein
MSLLQALAGVLPHCVCMDQYLSNSVHSYRMPFSAVPNSLFVLCTHQQFIWGLLGLPLTIPLFVTLPILPYAVRKYYSVLRA